MKKLFLILAAVALAMSANAQVRTSRTLVKQSTPTEWIVRAGLSLNSFSSDDDHVSTGTKAGFDVSVAFNKPIKKSKFYYGMELGIGSRGMKADITRYGDYVVSMSAYNVYLSPATIGYKFPVTRDIRIDPHLGAFVSCDFTTSTSYLNSGQAMDAGIQLGVGAFYHKFNLDFSYRIGFVSNDFDSFLIDHGSEDWTGKAHGFLIRIGYSF